MLPRCLTCIHLYGRFLPADPQSFVWDAEKAASNYEKHGVTFEQAAEVFFDPLVVYEDAGVEEELRDAAMGMDFAFDLLFVVHVFRRSGMYRIVSARRADGRERRRYEEHE